MTRIAINGIGVIAPGAIGIDAFRVLLAERRSAVDVVDRFDTTGLSAHKAALVRDFKARDYIPVMKMRRMNGLSRLGVAAAKLAIDLSRAGITWHVLDVIERGNAELMGHPIAGLVERDPVSQRVG